MKSFTYLFITILLVSFVSATTILDCKNAGTQDCVVNESSSVSSSQSPFIFDSLTINTGVTITVSADNGWGYRGGDGCNKAGTGGSGGGKLVIYSDDVDIRGTIRAKGEAGGHSDSERWAAGGGGAGGGILIYCDNISINGTLEADGGAGGDADGDIRTSGGGGGSAGTVWIIANNYTHLGTLTTQGGRGGVAGGYDSRAGGYGGSTGRTDGQDAQTTESGGEGRSGGGGGGENSGCEFAGGGGGGLGGQGGQGEGNNDGCSGQAYGGDGGIGDSSKRNILFGILNNSGTIESLTGGGSANGNFDIIGTNISVFGSGTLRNGAVRLFYDDFSPIKNSDLSFQRYNEIFYSQNSGDSGVATWSGWDLSTGYVIEITGMNSSGIVTFVYNETSGIENIQVNVSDCINNGVTLFGDSYSCSFEGSTLTISTAIVPRYNNFSSGITTNFTSYSNYTDIKNLSLTVSGKGRIKFPENHEVNANNQDYDRHVAIGPGYISVNSSGLDSSFNSTATLTFYNADCNSPYVYYSENATTLYGVLGENNLCTAPKCTNIQCSDGVLTVGVSSFSSFAVNGSANLTIDTDAPKSLHELVSFNATYLNSTGFITGATCNISFSDTSAIMDEQPGYYNYSRTFSSGRDLDYMVTCNKSGENTVSAEESFYIYPTGVPEFNLLTLGLGLAVILAGLFLIRKNGR